MPSKKITAKKVMENIASLKQDRMLILKGDGCYCIVSKTGSSDILINNGMMSTNFSTMKIRDEYTLQLYQPKIMVGEIYCKCIEDMITADNFYDHNR